MTPPRPTLAMVALLTACAPSIRPDAWDAADDTGGASRLTHVDNGDGTTTTEIDASGADWVYVDLPDWVEVRPDDATDSADWDLAFQRFSIKLNGGVSGPGGAEVAWVDGVDIAAVSAPPEDGYRTDEADADDDGLPEYAFDDWFDYDSETHVLTPKLRVYVLHSVQGATFSIQLLGYYDHAGSSAHPTLVWRHLGDGA